MSGGLAESAVELIRELESYNGKLPPFQENRLRSALQEMKTLFEQNCRDVAAGAQENPELLAAVTLRHAALGRNKHCILSYLYNRLKIIKDLRWDQGPVIPPDVRANMAEQEISFFANYNKLLANYMGSLGEGHGLDLTQDLKPPKSTMVEIRVLEDYGEVLLDNGKTVLLMKNSVHLLPSTQCENLLQQKIIEILK